MPTSPRPCPVGGAPLTEPHQICLGRCRAALRRKRRRSGVGSFWPSPAIETEMKQLRAQLSVATITSLLLVGCATPSVQRISDPSWGFAIDGPPPSWERLRLGDRRDDTGPYLTVKWERATRNARSHIGIAALDTGKYFPSDMALAIDAKVLAWADVKRHEAHGPVEIRSAQEGEIRIGGQQGHYALIAVQASPGSGEPERFLTVRSFLWLDGTVYVFSLSSFGTDAAADLATFRCMLGSVSWLD